MKKITVNKNDEVAVVVEKIIESEDSEIVLNIPRFSHLGGSLSNFHLLKREADAIGKRVAVESVDDHVIELSELSGLSAINPFFIKNKRQFSDIVAPKETGKANKRKLSLGKAPKSSSKESESPIEERFAALESVLDQPINPEKSRFDFNFFRNIRLAKPFFRLPEFESYKKYALLLAVGGLLLGFGVVGAQILPRAEVKIITKKQNWSYQDSILADKSASVSVENMVIPGQLFSQKKNLYLKFPASGRRQVEKFAAGEITVYNSYSSEPQTLLEKTRFVSPDGKLFRLAKTIVVPGAKIADGKIVPSGIAADVVADVSGPDYNIGPVKLFTIPGFKGTPKYQAFYGESIGNMAGGFVGEVAYPTAEDIKKAKAAAGEDLEKSLRAVLLSQVSQEFKVLDSASGYKLLVQNVDEEADPEKNFGIFSEAEIKLMVFKEGDLKDLLLKRAIQENGADFEVKNYTLEYGLTRLDLERGKVAFPVNFKAVLAKKINVEELKKNLAGKSQTELKPTLFSLPGFESGTVSTWPFFVRRVPNSIEKIRVEIN